MICTWRGVMRAENLIINCVLRFAIRYRALRLGQKTKTSRLKLLVTNFTVLHTNTLIENKIIMFLNSYNQTYG
jgi:hypothetical protein